GGGIIEVGQHIITHITPLTLGFVGAYFYVLQMLVRRYLADDLYPAAFLQGAQRMVVVFILSLALNVAAPLLTVNAQATPPTPTPPQPTAPPTCTHAPPPTPTPTPTPASALAASVVAALPDIAEMRFFLLTLAAFFAGIFPQLGLNLLRAAFNSGVKRFWRDT